MNDPAVILALVLLSLMSLTHLARPDVWRAVIGDRARHGPPDVVLYGMLHALPRALLIVLVERGAACLLRLTSKSIAAWRLFGVVDLVLITAIVLNSRVAS